MISNEIEDIRDMARYHLESYLTDHHPSVIKRLSHIAKMQGITDVVGINMPKCPEFRAVAVELKNGHQYIMFNSAQPIDIQEHYIAHELFHLIAEHPSGWSIERERAADIYAESLLELLSA